MQWSYPVAVVRGITVRLHLTFLLFLVWIGLSHYFAGGLTAAIGGITLMLTVFGSVLLHEFGHALAAQRYGIRIPDITLLPIGGVARLERMPDKPLQELIVAIAGPAVNVGIALVLWVALKLLPVSSLTPPAMSQQALFSNNLLYSLLAINVWLVLFNLIPAFPMDGGRVLRALLATRLGATRATRIAAKIGQGFAFLFVFLGFFGNPILIFIGLFVYMGAGSEASGVAVREFSKGVGVTEAMVTRVYPLREEAPLAQAIDALLSGSDKEFPVMDELGRVQGILRREDIVRGLNTQGAATPVGELMQRDVPHVTADATLDEAFQTMVTGNFSAVPVVSSMGNLIGLLTRDNVAEFMMIQGIERPKS